MRHRIRTILIGLAVGVVLLVVGAVVVVHRHSNDTTAASPIDRSAPAEIAAAANPSSQTLDQLITGLQARLATTPNDDVSWATLALAYVQQAKVGVDPTYYPKADAAVARSRAVNGRDNYLAELAESAVASARHDFTGARAAAERGLQINAYSPLLYGALSDAEIQLGDYTAGFAAVDKMVSLRPDTASLTRASYAAELRGDIAGATDLMQRALDRAPTASDRAFALSYLGELSFNAGDPDAALGFYNRAAGESPLDPAALGGKAKAEAALGQTDTALDHYHQLVDRYPEPGYVLEYGELLQSLGRSTEADAQFHVFRVTQQLFAANGVEPDSAATLFDAEHGDPAAALSDAESGIATRPFLVMYDADAWALHVNGRDTEALAAIGQALSTGMRNAVFHYHAGMIKSALGDIDGARDELTTALTINPWFSPVDAPLARQELARLAPASAIARPG